MKKLDYLIISFLAFSFCTFNLSAQQKAKDILAKAESIQNVDSAFTLYNSAYKTAEKEKNNFLMDSISFSIARRYIGIGKLDTARAIATQIINKYPNDKNNLLASGFYNLIAATFHHQNKLDSASVYYIKAIKILESNKDTLKAAKLRFNLANVFLSYKDYEQASKEFARSIDIFKQYGDSSILAGAISALATSHLQLGAVEKAKKLTNEGLKISLIRKDIVGEMLSYRQLGQIAEHDSLFDSSLVNYTRAYQLALKIQLPYYISMVEMNLCEIYSQLGDATNSMLFCKKSLEAVETNQFSSHLKVLYTNLSKSYALNGDYKNALLYANKASKIREEELSEDNKEIVNELLIKYESEKKDRQILEQKLNIAQKDRQNFIYASVAVISIIAIGILILLYYYRNKLNKARIIQINQEKEREVLKAILSGEESERNRLAVELHDGISNLLFSCKLSLSSIQTKEPEVNTKLSENLELLDSIREESRRMSHNLMPPNFSTDNLAVVFNEYINRINDSTPAIHIGFQFFGDNNFAIDDKLKLILYRAMQELVGNALKYANASEIEVQLFQQSDRLSIAIEDNGRGFDKETQTKGKGLMSLETRLSTINATIDIDSSLGSGTSATINLAI